MNIQSEYLGLIFRLIIYSWPIFEDTFAYFQIKDLDEEVKKCLTFWLGKQNIVS